MTHADGYTHKDPTIGVCWDADRLNLWRCGITLDPKLLSTEAARLPVVLAWSRSVHAAPPSWAEIEALARGVPVPARNLAA
jgi:hypothetical protein